MTVTMEPMARLVISRVLIPEPSADVVPDLIALTGEREPSRETVDDKPRGASQHVTSK